MKCERERSQGRAQGLGLEQLRELPCTKTKMALGEAGLKEGWKVGGEGTGVTIIRPVLYMWI